MLEVFYLLIVTCNLDYEIDCITHVPPTTYSTREACMRARERIDRESLASVLPVQEDRLSYLVSCMPILVEAPPRDANNSFYNEHPDDERSSLAFRAF